MRMFRKSVRGVDTSHQLALGVMFGMFVGLLPKDSMLPYFFLVIMILSPANLLSGACSGVLFSWIGTALDPVAHQLGSWVLTFDPLETTWLWLYQLPVVPWTRFENTVVMGILVIAILAAYPIYRLSLFFFDQYGKEIGQRFMQCRFVQWLVGSPAQPAGEG